MPVYFAQPVEGGPVKIGHTANVPKRIKELSGHYGKPLALLATMPGGRTEEKAVHERFSHLRFGSTEQFRPAADLMEFIGKPLLVGANPDAIEAMSPARPSDLKPVRLDLTPGEHRLLRLLAADGEMSMSAFAKKVLVETLRDKAARF